MPPAKEIEIVEPMKATRRTRGRAGSFRWRAYLLLGLLGSCALALIYRAVNLQLVDHGFLAKEGDARFSRVLDDRRASRHDHRPLRRAAGGQHAGGLDLGEPGRAGRGHGSDPAPGQGARSSTARSSRAASRATSTASSSTSPGTASPPRPRRSRRSASRGSTPRASTAATTPPARSPGTCSASPTSTMPGRRGSSSPSITGWPARTAPSA